MRSEIFTTRLFNAWLAAAVLLLASGASFAQQQVNLTAGPATATLPDGSGVPMWGYSCDATQVTGSMASCSPLNPLAGSGAWSPVVITVPTGQDLQINLTNHLSFPAAGSATPNDLPTSLVIVGQLGGGLGTAATKKDSPAHAIQGASWPIVGDTNGAAFNPPTQGQRVQSFATEVPTGATATLTWTAPRPGTYLIESGTHPSIQGPMGLFGVLVVTAAPSGSAPGTAYPGVSYAAELPLLLSEIDPMQNSAVQAAVTTAGFSETSARVLRDSVSSVAPSVDAAGAVINAGSGYAAGAAVTFLPTTACAAQPAAHVATVDSTGAILTVALDSSGRGCTQVPTATAAGGNGQAQLTAALTMTGVMCSDGAAACYPPAVNYTPLYYLVNGVAFDKTNPSASVFAASRGTSAAPVGGNVLVRLVNAGLHMHVPSLVGSQTGAASTSGLTLIAEDGNPLPGVPRVQSEVFMAAGKTYDVMVNAPAAGLTALPIYDRALSLSGNAFNRDAGMLAYLGINGAQNAAAAGLGSAQANPDTYNAVIAGQTLTVSDPAKGVLANDFNVFGVKVSGTAPAGLTLNRDGTFTYTGGSPTSFTYCGNGATSGGACALVTLGAATLEAASDIHVNDDAYTSNVATALSIKSPGVLANDSDGAGYPLTVAASSVTPSAGLTVSVEPNGGFNATVGAPGTYAFTYRAKNSQGTVSASTATVTLTFPTANGPAVTVLDGADKTTAIADYRWIIEEDRTFYVDPNCTKNPLPASCPRVTPQGAPAVFGTNFHTSHMPVVATGCTGPVSCESGQTLLGVQAVCDVGNGACRTDSTQQAPVDPSQVHIDPNKRYYISVLPGDAANPFNAGYAGAPDCSPAGRAAGSCGHGMGGAPIRKGQTSVTVLTQPTPNPPAKLTVFVFEDDYPLNGEHDASGGIDVLAVNEPGLGGFQITLFDDAGGTGDATGQPTYDMFNMPLTNSLAGTVDPVTGLDACPISTQVTANVTAGDGSQKGIVGMIVTCPKYESDGKTLSPLAGQAVVNNLYQGRYGVVARPGADRIARGEEWLQTNTLDGQKAHDSFMRIGEPAYFQEFGPGGYHVTIGFANPKIINDRKPGICANQACTHELKGHVTTARMSRPPDQRLYGSGSRDSFSFTQCFASLGDPDGADFAFVKCDDAGNFDFTGLPAGNWKLTVFDQWNDQIVDGISTPVGLTGTNTVLDLGEVAAHQWQANIYTRTFLDKNGNGVSDRDAQGNDLEAGLPLASTNIRFRDGSYSNFNNTDLSGYAGFNEVFPLFSWYVIETDSTRYKSTGTHVVYDSGGPVDGTCNANTAQCGSSTIAKNMANTYEANPLPADLSVPGAVYCAEGADCASSASSFQGGSPIRSSTTNHSSGRIDPPFWFGSYGWQGFAGQNSFLEFGKKPFAEHENGGIHGHVVYASTRPFDDPQLLLQLSWEPLIPHVRVNLYKEGVAADGITPTLVLVDHTDTSSFDDWAQGLRPDGKPNMNCPGQSTGDLFFYSLQNQPTWLDIYNNGTGARALPYSSQFKCYDGMHNFNQLQPAPYDGMYSFPSVTGLDPATGKPTGTNCTGCTTNPDTTDFYRVGAPMLPAGKYVVEVVVPPGYELVKEEDKNILIGDNYIAPVTQQFGGLGSIFILPDQAEVANAYNALNPTRNQGVAPRHEGDTGSVETFWPCVGAARVVPDYISLFPGSAEVAPFAGATRNLCDRKEVTLAEQSSALAKFYLFTSTHVAAHFTGIITDDFTAEFDPFSPQFGEKFSPAYLPVSIKDWTGNEIARTYSDQWGAYNGLNYSTWEVNPPNPTGYGPTMMVVCMNDSGSGATPDPLFQAGYSQFCYELPFMPGQTGYFDTPVVPTAAFSEGYNHPDCNYADATPAISRVDGDGVGPWLSAAGHTLTITALGDQLVDNYGYSGPSATTVPFNQEKVTRHYGFGTSPGQVALVGSDGVARPLTGVSWSDTTITGTVPTGVPNCPIQQQAQYGGSTARCGQLVVTNANGKASIDTVTVTIGGKPPTVLAAGSAIQPAIDAAAPGDLIIVPPGVYKELLLMWKPVRLQGVGAASSVIDANTHPASKLDPWRRQVVCLFGLRPDGRPASSAYDGCPATGSTNFSGGPDYPLMVADRLPFESLLSWDVTLNGNLAEQLIEPSLMGAFEGAAITVLGKGVKIPANDPDPYGGAVGAAYPAGSTLLSAGDCGNGGTNLYPTNYYCNPSRIDGLGVRNSSQGGGGIFVHAFAHNLQIANNRVYNNTGTMSGGITVGQGEHADVTLAGVVPTTFPGSCESSNVTNLSLPFCYNMNVNLHHNAVTFNSSMGDQLFSATPTGAGGVSINTGADYYRFANNWVCGNVSTGDGGGLAHIGFIKNGVIERNSILFNQSTNPTISTNGGGVLVMGAPDVDPPCSTNDQDCVPNPPSSVPPSDGTGPGLVINANLIMGNSADSGSGGGLRLQHVNGTDVVNFPNGNSACNASLSNCRWNSVSVTNNIITNNVAGWDGAGVSLQDALAVNIVNNTIASNDSTASAGVLFGSLFAPLASAPGTNCTTNNGTQSCAEVAGLVSVTNSAILKANLPSTGFSCPSGHGTSGNSGSCRNYSVPLLYNDVIWQNRSFFIGVGNFGTGAQNQQKVVTLYNSFGSTPALSQSATGACPTASYWDIGVRGDTGPSNHSGGRLVPTYSVLTDAADYPGANNSGSNPAVVRQYCNGSRVPPENGGMGWQVPPGTNEANALPTPVFSLRPSATVDEGNNWVNLRWGPLALTNPQTGTTLGNYSLNTGSPAIDYVPTSSATYSFAPTTDFFGNRRPSVTGGRIDVGAVENQSAPPVPTLTAISPNSGVRNASVGVTLTGTGLSPVTAIAVSGTGVTVSGLAVVNSTTVTATFAIAATAATGARTVTVTASSGTSNSVTFTVVAPSLTSINPTSGAAGTTVPVTIAGTGLNGATAVSLGVNIACTITGTPTATTVTASCVIASTATAGTGNVTVTTPGGAAGGVTFTVTAPTAPTLTSINPTSGAAGTTVPVTIAGTGLTGATAVSLGANITCTITGTPTATTVTASCVIASTAAAATGNVTVTTPGGTAGGVTFTVTAPTGTGPTLTGISPASGLRGTAVNVTLTGTVLTGATAVSSAGINVTNFVAVSSTTVTATLNLAASLATGPHSVIVLTPNGNTNGVAFQVNGAALSLSGPSPALITTPADATIKNGTITVTNAVSATAPSSFSAAPAVTKVGTAGGTFTKTGGTCVATTVLNPGDTCTITVQYDPLGLTVTGTAQIRVTGTAGPVLTQNITAN